MKNEYLPQLNGFRFLAALLVLIAHYGTWYAIPPASLVPYDGVTSFLGMAFFFVLSGFVIHYRYRCFDSTPLNGLLKQTGLIRSRVVRSFDGCKTPSAISTVLPKLSASR